MHTCSYYYLWIIKILLLPSLLKGRFFSRASLNNKFNGNVRERNMINLLEIEKKYNNKYGLFDLDEIERNIFFR